MRRSRMVVLVNGLSGAGKTTLSRPLSEALKLPLFSKDVIKETWGEILGATPPAERSQKSWNALFGAAASQTMWNLLAQSPCGGIIDSPLTAGMLSYVKAGLSATGVARPLEIWCGVPAELAERRRKERWVVMHPIHGEYAPAPKADGEKKDGEPLGLGPVLHVDTSGPVDIEAVTSWCHLQDPLGLSF